MFHSPCLLYECVNACCVCPCVVSTSTCTMCTLPPTPPPQCKLEYGGRLLDSRTTPQAQFTSEPPCMQIEHVNSFEVKNTTFAQGDKDLTLECITTTTNTTIHLHVRTSTGALVSARFINCYRVTKSHSSKRPAPIWIRSCSIARQIHVVPTSAAMGLYGIISSPDCTLYTAIIYVIKVLEWWGLM